MRTETTHGEVWDSLVNQFRGLVWSCHSLLEARKRAIDGVRILVYQMQQLKMGDSLLAGDLLFNLLTDIEKHLTFIWRHVGPADRRRPDSSAVWHSGEAAYTLLTRANHYLEGAPFVFITDRFDAFVDRAGDSSQLREVFEEHGITAELSKLIENIGEGAEK